jgi:aspartyl-tRNA(Asn)/glutamyl-tRNA(Gln) amidotransferase subunit A
MARRVEQIARLFDALADDGLDRAGDCEPEAPARIGLWADATLLATEDVRRLVDAALTRAIETGAVVEEAQSPAVYRDLLAIHHITMLVDGAAAHQKLITRYPDAYGPRVRSFVETGMAIPAHSYVRAQILRREARDRALTDWGEFDVIALPTAETPAPGLETTGSPALQSVVTMFRLPSVSLPVGLSPDGLPVGLQLVAPTPLGNARLLRIARWMEGLLEPLPAVPTGIADAADSTSPR